MVFFSSQKRIHGILNILMFLRTLKGLLTWLLNQLFPIFIFSNSLDLAPNMSCIIVLLGPEYFLAD